MKKLVPIAFLLLFSFSVQAQDKKAKDLLDQVTSKVKSYKNIVIDFKYALNNSKENINQESKGNVTIQGNMYVLNLMGVTKMFDGRKSTPSIPKTRKFLSPNLMRKMIQRFHLLRC
jgi:outer membrane lipoprotein-sorting protein